MPFIMPLLADPMVVYAYIVIALSDDAEDDTVQVLLYPGHFTFDDLAEHFRRSIVGHVSTLAGSDTKHCGYWEGSDSCLCLL